MKTPCIRPALRALLAMAAISALLPGCQTVEDAIGSFNAKRYARHNEPGERWLSDQMQPANINVSGNYRSRAWGSSFLAQNGREVRGHIGDYPVKGVVSGNKAYLLLSSDGWYYYSAVLEMPNPGLLVGYYSRGVPYRRDSRRDIELVTTAGF